MSDATGGQEPELEKVTEDLIGDMSEPTEAGVDDALNGYTPEEPTDTQGAKFDKEIHRTDDDGEPLLTKKGKFWVRPGRSKIAQLKTEVIELEETGPDLSFQQTASMAVMAIEQIGIMVGGTEARMETPERENMVDVYTQFFEEHGVSDIPPGIALAIVSVSYGVKVFTTDKGRKTFVKIKATVTGKRNALFNSGDDEQRKNHDGEKSGASVQAEGSESAGAGPYFGPVGSGRVNG